MPWVYGRRVERLLSESQPCGVPLRGRFVTTDGNRTLFGGGAPLPGGTLPTCGGMLR